MKYFAIGIWDDNTEYGLRLAEYLMHCTEYQIQIMTFSELRQLVKWIRKHRLDVLITGGDNALEEIRHMYYEDVFSDQKEEVQDLVSAVIELQDKVMEPVETGRNHYKVSRYWSSLNLMNFIIGTVLKIPDSSGIYGKRREKYGESIPDSGRMNRRNNVDIIGIFSPVSRCGKTTLSVAFTQLLGETERSLMICMDQYSEIFSSEQDNLSDLIFRMGTACSTESESQQDLFSDYVRNWNQMEYIPSPVYEDDLNQISSLQMVDVLKLLKEQSRYRYIVVDIRTGMDNLQEILQQCDQIFMPDPGDTVSSSKIHMFEELMRKQRVQETEEEEFLLNRIHKVRLPEVIQTNTLENYYKELGWSSFGKCVREVMERYDVGGIENRG
ncbi:MAG: hypothetical protein ACI4D7_12085 [Lachnospiraceae bacterium]